MTTWSEYITTLECYLENADLALRRKTILSVPKEFLSRPNAPIPEEYQARVKKCEEKMSVLISFGENRTKEIQDMLRNIYFLENQLPVMKGKIITTVI